MDYLTVMNDVRYCHDHGYFAAEACPVCNRPGERVVTDNQRRQLSGFMSGALRHFPSDVGLDLDNEGWTGFDDLVATVDRKYQWAEHDAVEGIIITDPKGRFERDNNRVRAVYGHSVDVDIETDDGPVPDTLYHGTAPRNLDAIREEGLRPMSRQQVHLSESLEEAETVGQRYTSDPVVLAVDVATMKDDDFRIEKRGESTYTTDSVPPRYLHRET
jgi:putative RNA 2'-phosphotransferase